MREILFRGKRIDSGERVYGFLYETEKSSSYNAESYILEKEKLTINYKCVEGITTHIPFVQVTPDTVGQYTGLTDKNGKKIFEGDIVVVPLSGKPAKGIVEYFKTDICGFVVITQPQYSNYVLQKNDTYEVIGNIHDNPKILEKGA